jgi:hypothetical protein
LSWLAGCLFQLRVSGPDAVVFSIVLITFVLLARYVIGAFDLDEVTMLIPVFHDTKTNTYNLNFSVAFFPPSFLSGWY